MELGRRPDAHDTQAVGDLGQPLPPQGPGLFEQRVSGVIRAVDHKQIPSGQYQAVMIDEGHDFEAAWLKLAAQMVEPETNSLLLLYDGAQSIYQRRRGPAVQLQDQSARGQRQDIDDACQQGTRVPRRGAPGTGQMPEDGHDEAEKARLFHVAATRATQRLFITLSGEGKFASRLHVSGVCVR